ncbi:hypothetical protein KP77_25320 [Jeotgalibacillus alimentarius]|uniref:dUTPase n=1 Tax=Jeotgalibacillus alimentarius TaxID=135826 RepID=A0A0C2VSL0_9BACL|nr:dUTP diphosphatase [Jeotgalibacillus alimentarius]KIL46963.1 hypothetical protein KP77_25320 [Jeotgalibacillus alimentarius]
MELIKMYNAQRQLDEHIEKEHPRQPGEERMTMKIIALFVEASELANEIRAFKYWSTKDPSDKPVILDEIADVISFLLSIGNDNNWTDILLYHEIRHMENEDVFENDVNYMTALMFMTISEFAAGSLKQEYNMVFAVVVKFAFLLGFTWEEIEAAYFKKNQINHIRQENSY